MISFKHLAQVSFHFTCPNKANRKEFWLAFLYPAVVGLTLSVLPILIWETIYLLVVINILPEKLMIVVNFMIKFLVFLAFATPLLYTYMIVSIKRLHDLGRSGFWWLVNLIPVIVLGIMNYFGNNDLWLLTRVTPIVMFLFIIYVGFTQSKRGTDGCLDIT